MFNLVLDFIRSIFGKGTMNTVFTWIILAIIVMVGFTAWAKYDDVLTYFGFDTKENLKKQVKQQEQVITDLKNTNEGLVDTVEKQQESEKVTLDTVVDYYDKVNENEEDFNVIDTDLDKRLRDLIETEDDYIIIETDFSTEPIKESSVVKPEVKEPVKEKKIVKVEPSKKKVFTNPKPKKQKKVIKIDKKKADLVSEANIVSIWDAYCLADATGCAT